MNFLRENQNIHFTEITIFIILKLITFSKKVFKYMIGKKVEKRSINNYLKITIFCKCKQNTYQIRGVWVSILNYQYPKIIRKTYLIKQFSFMLYY